MVVIFLLLEFCLGENVIKLVFKKDKKNGVILE